MQRIIFHIGDKKTGSTSIQQALVRRAWRCDTVSLDYAVPPEAPYHHELAFSLLRNDTPKVAALFADLSDRIAASRADVVVVSSELFRDVEPGILAEALQRYLPRHAARIEILGYMRPHAPRLLSSYAQEVKLGYFLGMPEAYFKTTLQRGKYYHARLFLAWRDVFGDRLTVRPMIRPLLRDGNVIADFFEQVLGGAAFELAPMPEINASPSLEDLALLRRFHKLLRECGPEAPDAALKTARMRVGEHLGELLCDTPVPTATRARLHRALVAQIAEAYAEDAAEADRAFFEGTPMQDALREALQNAPEEAQSLWAKDHLSPEIQRNLRVWAQLVNDMLQHSPAGWNDHFLGILNRALRGQTA